MSKRLIRPTRLLACLALGLLATAAQAQEPLHVRIDAAIAARAGGLPLAAPADDAEFLRRLYLDLTGRIPTTAEARAFLAESTPDKRTLLLDALLSGPDYAQRMQEAFSVMLLERQGENPEWAKFLRLAFEQNRPWDQMVRQMLDPNPEDEATRGAAFFLSKRLENHGQNPVDLPGLTRDVGRLFTDFTQTTHLDRWHEAGDVRFIFGMDLTAGRHVEADDLPETAWKPLRRPIRAIAAQPR